MNDIDPTRLKTLIEAIGPKARYSESALLSVIKSCGFGDPTQSWYELFDAGYLSGPSDGFIKLSDKSKSMLTADHNALLIIVNDLVVGIEKTYGRTDDEMFEACKKKYGFCNMLEWPFMPICDYLKYEYVISAPSYQPTSLLEGVRLRDLNKQMRDCGASKSHIRARIFYNTAYDVKKYGLYRKDEFWKPS